MKITKIDSIPKKNEKLKVAAYCRVSTSSDEQLESLENQKHHYESLIRLHSDWIFAGLYYDSGVSGTKTALRDGFQNMLSDCRAGKIDRILVKSISRFSRNITDCLSVIRELQKLGISVYFEKENVDTGSMENELIISVLSSMAAEESVSISQNQKWSVRKRFESGTYKISCAPYGYNRTENGELEINESEAAIVNMIFEKVINGVGVYTIAKELNAAGIPAKRSDNWSDRTILGIIENEKYIGDTLFQKTFTDGNFTRHRNTGEKDSYLVTDSHDAIIRREIYDKANEIIRMRARYHHTNTGVYQNRYCFSGNIKCGKCGDVLKRVTIAGHHICWSCRTHIQNIEKCELKAISDESVKAAFATMLNKLIFSKRYLLRPYYEKISSSENNENGVHIEQLREKLKENTRKADTLRRLRAHSIIDSVVFNKEINQLENDSESIRKELENCSNIRTDTAVVVREAEKILKFAEHSIMQDQFSDTFYNEFTESATVIERNEIVFHLKCGLNLREELQCMVTE